MNKTIVVFLTLFLSISYGYARNVHENKMNDQANNDSIVIFTFKANNGMFFIPYQNNEDELNRLLKMTKQYDAEIKNGQLFVYVNGYCYGSINPERNLTLARTWSNRVKSELIVRRKLKEENFITANHAKPYDDLNNVVVVMLKFPREIIKEEHAEPEPAVATATKQPEPTVIEEVVKNEETGETTAIQVTVPPKGATENVRQANLGRSAAKAPATFSEHTNLLYWAIATPNFGVEWRPGTEKKWGMLLSGAWTNWQWRNGSRRYRLWMINPEVRHYVSERWFVGIGAHVGELNIKLSDTGRQGMFFGAGVLGGYRLPINRRFDIDFTLGFGYTRFNQDEYTRVDGVNVVTCRDADKNIIGPTQIGVILRYKLK